MLLSPLTTSKQGKRMDLGENHIINIDVYPYDIFSDENMLLDMIRENLTHRGDDYRDLADSVMLAKRWLESGSPSVKGLYTWIRDEKGHLKGNSNQGIGSRQVYLLINTIILV